MPEFLSWLLSKVCLLKVITKSDLDTDKDSKLALHLVLLEDDDGIRLPSWWMEVRTTEITRNDIQHLIEELPYVAESLDNLIGKL